MRFPTPADPKVDITDSLNDWLAGSPNGTTVDLPAGRWRVDGTVRVTAKPDFVVNGNGATLYATTPGTTARRHFVIEGGGNVTVVNMTVTGSHINAGSHEGAYNQLLEGQHGVAAYGVNVLALHQVNVDHTYGDLLYMGRDPYTRQPCRNVTVTGCHLHHAGRHGVTVTHGERIAVVGNAICETARASVDLEPNSLNTWVQRINISGNVFGPGRLNWIAAAGNRTIGEVDASGNKLVGKAMTVALHAPEGTTRHGFRISDNISDAPPNRTPIRAIGITGLTVTGNTQAIKKGSAGVNLERSVATDVSRNNWTFPDGSPAPQFSVT